MAKDSIKSNAIERRYRTSKDTLANLLTQFTRKYFGLEGNDHPPFLSISAEWDLGQLHVRGEVLGYTDALGLGSLSLVSITPTVLNDEWLKMEAWAMDWKHQPGAKKVVDEFFTELINALDYYFGYTVAVESQKETSRAVNQLPIKPVELSMRRKTLIALILVLLVALVLLTMSLLVAWSVLSWQVAVVLIIIGLVIDRATNWIGAWNNIIAVVEKFLDRR